MEKILTVNIFLLLFNNVVILLTVQIKYATLIAPLLGELNIYTWSVLF